MKRARLKLLREVVSRRWPEGNVLVEQLVVFGFAKNERSNVSDKELETLKRLASQLLGYDARELREALSTGKLYEVESDG